MVALDGKVRCFGCVEMRLRVECAKWGKSRPISGSGSRPPRGPGGATWVVDGFENFTFLERDQFSIKHRESLQLSSISLFRPMLPKFALFWGGILEIPNGTVSLISVLSSQALSSLPSFPQLRESFSSLKYAGTILSSGIREESGKELPMPIDLIAASQKVRECPGTLSRRWLLVYSGDWIAPRTGMPFLASTIPYAASKEGTWRERSPHSSPMIVRRRERERKSFIFRQRGPGLGIWRPSI